LFQLNLTDTYHIIEIQKTSILIIIPKKKEKVKDQKEIEENLIIQEDTREEDPNHRSILATDTLVKH